METRYYDIMPSPVGDLTLVSDGTHLLSLWLGASEEEALRGPYAWRASGEALAPVRAELDAYFAGELRAFTVPTRAQGTAFQQRVWRALSGIPYGETTSYGEIATRIGASGSARAVGAANGRNPLPIIVPCHRVIGAGGALVGYGGGLPRKTWLLTHEARAGRGSILEQNLSSFQIPGSHGRHHDAVATLLDRPAD